MKGNKRKICLFIWLVMVSNLLIDGVYAESNYDLFVDEITNYVDEVANGNSAADIKQNVVDKIVELEAKYEDNSRVDYLASKLMAEVTNLKASNTSKLVSAINKSVNAQVEQVSLLSGDSSLPTPSVWSMNSNTVCSYNSDSKYCVNLKAKVYIVDPNSTKWVVLVHGNMMSGEAMANAVGSMYASQGVNILAPDLRGFGDSEGSVAMGYLEALDVYDWLAKLNSEYTNISDVIVHGVSLGGATTLQLWNLQGSSAGGDISKYHVKGIVDDCGYTSMKGIITGMLSSSDLSTGNLDLSGVTDVLSNIGLSSEQISGFSSIFENYNKYLPQLEGIEQNYNQNIDGWLNEVTEAAEAGVSSVCSSNPSLPFCTASGKSDAKVTLTTIGTDSSLNLDSILDSLIKKALIDLVGVGLTENDFDVNQDAFHSSRIPSKINGILIIHGTSDTTVPYSNAGVVEQYATTHKVNNISKFYASGQPHAFIIVGSEKEKYTEYVQNFSKDILGTAGYNESASTGSKGGILETISDVFSKITSFFKNLFS